ncbi:ABC transporter ATP-binding protein [Herbaspirillum robiniae]|uniref:ABC transporter ATP-binding protein n=1 Tax=Herbaspirillum robiniae TaxID=2014887 RepID=UPI003D787FE3
MSVLLDVKNLKVDLPTENGMLHAVRGIDFQVRRGEMLCLVGESGCGKSMTSLALMGLLPRRAQCSADHILFDGTDLNGMAEKQLMQLRGKRMSMIFQEPMTSLNPAYALGNQLCEAMLQQPRVTRAEARERAIYLLHRTGITNAEDRLRQYPHQLSGGLRQRVMIAMSLMCSPDLIIADEPTTALDVTIQAQILRMIRELQQEFGTAVIFITHDLGVVSRIADRVAVMYAGQVVETTDVGQLFEQPRHPYTRGLLNCIPVRGKTLPGSRLQAIPGVVPSLVGNVGGCAFRNRCTLADAVCETDPPMPDKGGPAAPHYARCHKLDAMAQTEKMEVLA